MAGGGSKTWTAGSREAGGDGDRKAIGSEVSAADRGMAAGSNEAWWLCWGGSAQSLTSRGILRLGNCLYLRGTLLRHRGTLLGGMGHRFAWQDRGQLIGVCSYILGCEHHGKRPGAAEYVKAACGQMRCARGPQDTASRR